MMCLRQGGSAGVRAAKHRLGSNIGVVRNLSLRLIGLLLLTAALLKWHQAMFFPLATNLVFESRIATVALIEIEIILGVALVIGNWVKPVWYVGLALVSAFTVVTIRKAIAGDASCSCFGVLSVSPYITLIIDLFSIVVLCLSRNLFVGGNNSLPRIAFPVVVVLCVIILGAVPVTVYSQRIETVDGENAVTVSDGLVTVAFDQLLGKAFPFENFLSGPTDWKNGNTVLLFFRNNCPKCDRELERLLSNGSHRPKYLVEIPPALAVERKSNERFKWLKLSSDFTWLIDAPVSVHLRNGQVVEVTY